MQVEKVHSTVFTPLADGTGVLLNLDTLLYYSLNRTGTAVWKQIDEKKTVTLDDLVLSTCNQFDIDQAGARQALASFVEELLRLKMVHLA
jgi:hypothetical protein